MAPFVVASPTLILLLASNLLNVLVQASPSPSLSPTYSLIIELTFNLPSMSRTLRPPLPNPPANNSTSSHVPRCTPTTMSPAATYIALRRSLSTNETISALLTTRLDPLWINMRRIGWIEDVVSGMRGKKYGMKRMKVGGRCAITSDADKRWYCRNG